MRLDITGSHYPIIELSHFFQVFFFVLDYLTADWTPNVQKKF